MRIYLYYKKLGNIQGPAFKQYIDLKIKDCIVLAFALLSTSETGVVLKRRYGDYLGGHDQSISPMPLASVNPFASKSGHSQIQQNFVS